jgi:hypothetical protein
VAVVHTAQELVVVEVHQEVLILLVLQDNNALVLRVKMDLETLEGVVQQDMVVLNMVEGLMVIQHPTLKTVNLETLVSFTYLNILELDVA